MADINFKQPAHDDRRLAQLVELLFFAYRDFVSDPDAILGRIGFGQRPSSGRPFRRPQPRHAGGRAARHSQDHQAIARTRSCANSSRRATSGRKKAPLIDASGFSISRPRDMQLKLQLISPQIDRFRRALAGPATASDSAATRRSFGHDRCRGAGTDSVAVGRRRGRIGT